MSVPVHWIHRLTREDGSEFRLGRSGDQVVAEWVGVATLRAAASGQWAELSVESGIERTKVEEGLRFHLAALLGHLRGEIALHASTVALGGVAVTFVGDSLAGKSTIAMQACAGAGVEFLSDDTAALDFSGSQIAVVPTEREHALRPDVASALGFAHHGEPKIRTNATRRGTGPSVLGALVGLRFDDSLAAPIIRRIHGAQAFSILSRAVVRFVVDDPAILRSELDKLARLASEVPFYELVRSHGLSNLGPTAQLATQLLRSVSRVLL